MQDRPPASRRTDSARIRLARARPDGRSAVGYQGLRGSGRPVFNYARQKRRSGGAREGRSETIGASKGSRGDSFSTEPRFVRVLQWWITLRWEGLGGRSANTLRAMSAVRVLRVSSHILAM